MNNSVRQVGGALGVAILGSVLAGAYAAHLGDATDALPESAREQADESIVGTLAAVDRVQEDGTPEEAAAAAGVVEPAREAFVDAMHITAVGTAAAGAIAVVVVLVWLPGRRDRVTAPTGAGTGRAG